MKFEFVLLCGLLALALVASLDLFSRTTGDQVVHGGCRLLGQVGGHGRGCDRGQDTVGVAIQGQSFSPAVEALVDPGPRWPRWLGHLAKAIKVGRLTTPLGIASAVLMSGNREPVALSAPSDWSFRVTGEQGDRRIGLFGCPEPSCSTWPRVMPLTQSELNPSEYLTTNGQVGVRFAADGEPEVFPMVFPEVALAASGAGEPDDAAPDGAEEDGRGADVPVTGTATGVQAGLGVTEDDGERSARPDVVLVRHFSPDASKVSLDMARAPAQAAELAKHLKARLARHPEGAIVFLVSPKLRTQQSYELLASALGLPKARKITLPEASQSFRGDPDALAKKIVDHARGVGDMAEEQARAVIVITHAPNAYELAGNAEAFEELFKDPSQLSEYFSDPFEAPFPHGNAVFVHGEEGSIELLPPKKP